jgi:deazaflavin-dependent oxidoreductase (nitroreductase family)
MTTQSDQVFERPSAFERAFGRLLGGLIRLGLALPHNYLVEVRGRKTGRVYTAPIDLVEIDARRFLVCPRGRTQWARNAEAAGELALLRGGSRQNFTVRLLPDSEKPDILKWYLDRFKLTVQRFFPVPAGSPATAFTSIVGRYPVFELYAKGSTQK